jgi:hypothetical protein
LHPLIEENHKLKSCFTCFTGLLQDGTILFSYQFESFASGYPKSEKVQEAAYLGPKSYSMLSPIYSLDQTDTYKD